MASRVCRPCLSAFLLPRGAPEPGAPPCIRHRYFPFTAGDMQDLPERVLAPQRRLDSIGPILRGWSPAIFSPATDRDGRALRLVKDRHCRLSQFGLMRTHGNQMRPARSFSGGVLHHLMLQTGLAMVSSAQWHGELIAHLAPERSAL